MRWSPPPPHWGLRRAGGLSRPRKGRNINSGGPPHPRWRESWTLRQVLQYLKLKRWKHLCWLSHRIEQLFEFHCRESNVRDNADLWWFWSFVRLFVLVWNDSGVCPRGMTVFAWFISENQTAGCFGQMIWRRWGWVGHHRLVFLQVATVPSTIHF